MKTLAGPDTKPLVHRLFILLLGAGAFWFNAQNSCAQNLYVTQTASTVGEFNATTAAPINTDLVVGFNRSILCIAVYGNNLFVALDNGTVGEYDAITGIPINPRLITGLSNILGLAVSENNLYVSWGANFNSLNSRVATVGKFDATTGIPINANFITSLGAPYGLAVSGNYLFVSDFYTGTIGEYNATTGAPISPNFIVGLGVRSVTGLAVSGGSLFVAAFAPSLENNGQPGTVGVYNAKTGAPIAPSLITQIIEPTALGVSGNNLFVEDESGEVGEYDATTGAPINDNLFNELGSQFGIAVGTGGLGFDISTRYAPVLQGPDWQLIYNAGYSFVILGTWGGTSNGEGNPNYNYSQVTRPIGQYLLNGARTAGLRIGSYCLLSWTSTLSGTEQVEAALSEAGAEAGNLSFLAIDVETDANNPLGVSNPDQRIARIADAIQTVRTAGLRPIIYSSGNSPKTPTVPGNWALVTGSPSTGTLSTGTAEISGFPLWDVRADGSADLSTSYGSSFSGYEGVGSRLIKQYAISNGTSYLTDPEGDPLMLSSGSLSADLDSSALNAFLEPSINPLPVPVLSFQPSVLSKSPIISVGGISISGTVVNTSPVSSAIATRIVSATLQLPGPTSLKIADAFPALFPMRFNTIPAGGSAPLSNTLDFLPPVPYHGPAILKLLFTTGGASTDAGGGGEPVSERIDIP